MRQRPDDFEILIVDNASEHNEGRRVIKALALGICDGTPGKISRGICRFGTQAVVSVLQSAQGCSGLETGAEHRGGRPLLLVELQA